MTEHYTDEECELLRQQLRNGNAAAREAVKRLGIKLHPRIAAKRLVAQLDEQFPPKE